MNDRGFLNHANELVRSLVATPDMITAAVYALLAGSRNLLLFADSDPEPAADRLTPALTRAVDQGDIDPDTAAQLAFYA